MYQKTKLLRSKRLTTFTNSLFSNLVPTDWGLVLDSLTMVLGVPFWIVCPICSSKFHAILLKHLVYPWASALLIQVMENLQTFTKLQELWLGRNRIKVVNLCGLNCIKKISLQSNRLTSMRGFEVLLFGAVNVEQSLETVSSFSELLIRIYSYCTFSFQECIALEELYLSHNGISKMEGLSTLVNLRVLDVSSNKLTSVDGIENLTQYILCFFSLSL